MTSPMSARHNQQRHGTVTRADGDQSEGAPPCSGQHTHRYPNGDTYNGGFVDGLQHGQGEMVYANGDRCLRRAMITRDVRSACGCI